MREAGLELVGTDLLIAGMALRTTTAARDERHSDAVANLEALHAVADRDYAASQLMARHMWQLDVRIVPHPAMPVAAANSTCADLDHDAALTR